MQMLRMGETCGCHFGASGTWIMESHVTRRTMGADLLVGTKAIGLGVHPATGGTIAD